ncbi:hypothetical protein C6W96_05495 [Streptomyces sp. CS149]|nr:hypothetical protein C6W96_05495 [Streptomyces sp. CS149]
MGRLRRACPLPAPSRNRGSAPDPAPQAPEGLRAPGRGEERGRRGRASRSSVTCCGFWPLLPRRPCPAVPSVRRR